MSKIVKVSQSDYRLKVVSGGNITLDTGVNTGIVRVTGNLIVDGEYVTVNTTNMEVEDNILLLNRGETGAGVTEGFSGIQVDRGSLNDAQVVWKESVDKFSFQTTTGGVTPVDTLAGVLVGSIATDPTTNLEFDMQSGGGTLRITNSTGYESRVLNNNDIPNRKWITDYVYAYGGYAVTDKIFNPVAATPGNEDTLVEANTTNIKFYIKSSGTLNQRAQITSQGLDVDNINVFNNTINNPSGSNLILTALNKNVEINGVLNLDDQVSDATATGGTSRIYSKSTTGPGKTGLFFASNIGNDELVAKNRALLFSVLF